MPVLRESKYGHHSWGHTKKGYTGDHRCWPCEQYNWDWTDSDDSWPVHNWATPSLTNTSTRTSWATGISVGNKSADEDIAVIARCRDALAGAVAARPGQTVTDAYGSRIFRDRSPCNTGARQIAQLGYHLLRVQILARQASAVIWRYVADAPWAAITQR